MAAPTIDQDFELDLDLAVGKYREGLVLKSKQKECLFNVYQGRDIIGNLPTGYGKSIIYHLLPELLALQSRRRRAGDIVSSVLVVCPLNIIQVCLVSF